MLPELNRIRKSATQIDVFRGLNRTANTGFSRVGTNSTAIFIEFKDMTNLCSDEFPKLKTRKQRSRLFPNDEKEIISNILVVNGKMLFINSDLKLCFDGEEFTSPALEGGAHSLTQYGNRVVIMPEKLYFDFGTRSFEEIEVTTTLTQMGAVNSKDEKTGYWSNFSIDKVSLDDYGKPRPIKNKILTGMDFSDISNQLPYDSNNNYKYQNFFLGPYNPDSVRTGGVKEGETVEALTASPSVVYKCVSISEKANYNSDNKVRRFIKENNYYVRICTVRSDSGSVQLRKIKKGDFVKLSGMKHGLNVQDTQYQELADFKAYISDSYIDVLNGNTFKVYDTGQVKIGDFYYIYIVIKANIECSIPYGHDNAVAGSGEMTIERVMPPIDSDKLIEVNNRLWACSSQANEIYCCKQGDCTNWQAYGDGISTDSFAATVGCEGDFTGMARQNDSVIFFKENWIIKVYGTKPSNFQTAMFNVPGVEKGSGKSIVWINGVLFYLSPKGVCRYSPGGHPVVISETAFGDVKYKNGVAGRHGEKYVLSAENESGEHELLVFDTASGLWHKEDNTVMIDTVSYNSKLYYVDGAEKHLMCLEKDNNLIEELDGFEEEGQFDWSCETGDLYDSDFNAKYITKIRIHADIEENGSFKVLAKFKDGGAWLTLRELEKSRSKPRAVDIAVRRSDFLRLRLEGTGQCRISGILIEYARGSGIR